MKLNALRIQNFRRLKNVVIDLEDTITIFVGANNSGKTSATQALDLFINGPREKISIFDFSSDCWSDFTAIGENGFTPELNALPVINLDLWFTVNAQNLHRIRELLPGLEWEDSEIGLRIQFQPKSTEELILHFREARQKVAAYVGIEGDTYHPWPGTLVDYLERELTGEYHFGYYALDRAHFDAGYQENQDFDPKWLKPELAKAIIKSILKVDCLNAQRHLSDSSSGARAEDLSKCLSRFYKRNLEKRDEDHDALKALSTSEQQLNNHLARVFEGTLTRISTLGYPGFNNPTLVIKSALNPTMIMTQDTKVHYALEGGEVEVTLPDSYNGLGFKNLIYMVVEILDLQNRWKEEEENRAALHLIFIEEPEAHLHAQLQQVFINKVLGLLQMEGDDQEAYKTQMVVTSHSSHILYERGFKPIRYFRRESGAGIGQSSSCINLSQFYRQEVEHRDFLEKYLKLTHCDLFFADAAILVEGNVERLLMPLMIKKAAPALQSSYLSILEVNGAFAYQFKSLLEYLGIATLIITDIDSVLPRPAPAANAAPPNPDEENAEEDDDDEENAEKPGSKCIVSLEGAHTSNQTLRTWLPRMITIADLLDATAENCIQEANDRSRAVICVTYQKRQEVTYSNNVGNYASRTFEEAFGLANAEWCQNAAQRKVGLRFAQRPENTEALAVKLHKRVSGKSFDKTKFALNLLTKNEDDWQVPAYIRDGLTWLQGKVSIQVEADPIIAAEVQMPAEVAVAE